MKTKKLIAIGLSALMALSLAAPAFALGDSSSPSPSQSQSQNAGAGSDVSGSAATNTYSINIPGGYEEIPLSVIIIGTGKAVINPYALPYEIALETEEISEAGNVVLPGTGITTTPLGVVNMTAAKLNIGATLTASGTVTIGEAGDYSATDDADGDQAKGIYGVKLEVLDGTQGAGGEGFKEFASTGLSYTEEIAELRDAIAVQCADNTSNGWASAAGKLGTLEMDDDAIEAGFKTLKAGAGASVITGGTGTANSLGQLDAYDEDKDVLAKNVAVFRITGTATMNPAEGWSEADTINLGVAVNFAVGT